MNFLSLCSGIEAASVAWLPLGWECIGHSEIEAFPNAVLKHHYPDVPNYGDMTKYKEWPDVRPDLIIAGTPCQAFSVAGLRKGLDDPRGNLTLTYLAVIDRYRPKWVVWENVPGVLSDKTGAFGSFLGGLGELGYGFAYRILDAQYFGVAQRRHRVFVVGYLGDWRPAAAVLFERHSLSGHPAPSREKGKRTADDVAASLRSGGNGGVPSSRGEHLTISHWDDDKNPHPTIGAGTSGTGGIAMSNQEIFSQRGCGLVPDTAWALQERDSKGPDSNTKEGHLIPTLVRMREGCDGGGKGPLMSEDKSLTLARANDQTLFNKMQVRRLTPVECERLQGFPDNYTRIPWRNKPAEQCPYGPRYKALGNSMAVPVIRWIGERIMKVEAL